MPTEQPRVVLLAGPNGSGKSTFYRSRGASINWPIHHVDPDVISAQIQEEFPDITTEELNLRAFREARALRRDLTADRESFSVESVFSHPSTLADMERWSEAGFEITLVALVTEHFDINIERVKRRVLEGGHFVEPDRIAKRHGRFMALLPLAMERSTEVILYNMSAKEPQLCLVGRHLDSSLNTITRLPTLAPIGDTSSYVTTVIMDPWEERLRERNLICSQFTGELTHEARVAQSHYTGPIVWDGKHLLLQSTQSDGFTVHNRVLIDNAPSVACDCVIQYVDGVASIRISQKNA